MFYSLRNFENVVAPVDESVVAWYVVLQGEELVMYVNSMQHIHAIERQVHAMDKSILVRKIPREYFDKTYKSKKVESSARMDEYFRDMAERVRRYKKVQKHNLAMKLATIA